MRILRLVYELYEAANSNTANKISIMVTFCDLFNLLQYFFCSKYFNEKAILNNQMVQYQIPLEQQKDKLKISEPNEGI